MMEKDYEDFACKNDALAGTALKREDGMRKPVYRNISAGGKEANRRRWGCSIANFSRFSKKFAISYRFQLSVNILLVLLEPHFPAFNCFLARVILILIFP